MDRSVGAAPEVRLVPSDVRKILSFLKAMLYFMHKNNTI